MSLAEIIEAAAPVRRFKPYPAYKDSGVEWLGEIPAHWEVKRLKYATSKIGSGKTPSGGAEVYVSDGVMLLRSQNVHFSGLRLNDVAFIDAKTDSEMAGSRVRNGDVLLNITGASLGRCCVARIHGASANVNQHVCLIRPKGEDFNSVFLSAALASRSMQDQIFNTENGISRDALNFEQISELWVARPPISEQQAISEFLDRKAEKIDMLVAKKEKLIELLQEQRTALITRAVTKGLDPNASMKDSGIEWLGEIPAYWEVLSVKRRAKRIQTGSTPPTSESSYYENGTIEWYGPGSFSDDLPLQQASKLISEDAVRDGVARLFAAGSAVIVTIGATIGKVAFMEETGSFNQQITGITFDTKSIFPQFGAYQLKSLEPVLRGIAPNTTLPIFDQEEVGYLPLAIPAQHEQRAITLFIDRETARIDKLIATVRGAIERLQEFRTALISAAVIGKIDVREEVA